MTLKSSKSTESKAIFLLFLYLWHWLSSMKSRFNFSEVLTTKSLRATFKFFDWQNRHKLHFVITWLTLQFYVLSREVGTTGTTGHFTQVIWAETYKVGCGFIIYQEGKWYKRLYSCNYGHGGNMAKAAIYLKGEPCSKCPSDTTCEDSLCAGRF